MKSLCVFCGSNTGNDPAFIQSAQELARLLVEQGTALVYGGGRTGLMGVIADAVMEKGGKVTGIIPKFLETKEIGHRGLTELITCESMHERKTMMFERSQGFIAMPGGFGTLEEIIEVLTWHQLGLHPYPIAFLNVNGFYDSLKALFEQMETSQLLKPENKKMAIFADSPFELLEKMRAYRAPTATKWIHKT